MENWMKELDGAVTICNKEGIIVYMNDRSVESYKDFGGAKLLGTDLMPCHSEDSKKKLAGMLSAPTLNIYTTEKNGKKKIIYQAPWMENGKHMGIIELALPIPSDMPHFIRS